jgi:hypothetical protein
MLVRVPFKLLKEKRGVAVILSSGCAGGLVQRTYRELSKALLELGLGRSTLKPWRACRSDDRERIPTRAVTRLRA